MSAGYLQPAGAEVLEAIAWGGPRYAELMDDADDVTAADGDAGEHQRSCDCAPADPFQNDIHAHLMRIKR